MPEIKQRHIGVAADMFGCPNRCRHCYIGNLPNGQMTEDDLRWALEEFRGFVRPGETEPFFESIDVLTWNREPDFSDDYRRLYELEVDLSDVKTYRAEWELMSVWRVVRDVSYAPWAHSIGIRTCQITFFGVGDTQDWFYRRRGAFDDCILATECLLDAGIKPRWQVFFTTKIISELGEIMRLVDKLKLRERCAGLGGEFVMFIHTPSPEGEAEFIEHLRPTIDQASAVPEELIESTRRHDPALCDWKTVGERVREILESEEDHHPYAWSFEGMLWFIVHPDWSVYTNFGTSDPWWKLGNLQKDSVQAIVDRYENNRTLALHTVFNLRLRELAERYGDPTSRLIEDDVENLWLARHCAELYREGIYVTY